MQPLNRLHNADVVAVFENQDDADEALLQLRLAGFRDDHIGYFSWHPTVGLTNLLDCDYGAAGSVLGGILGALLGVGLAMLLDARYAAVTGASDLLGLAITCGTFGSLFIGFLGWWVGASIPANGVEAPAVDPTVGPFIMMVAVGNIHDDPSAQAAHDRAWDVLQRNGGHELPPGAMVGHPSVA